MRLLSQTRALRKTRAQSALTAALILIACLRMAATFGLYSQTNDEATHVGAGVELLQLHRYELQRENPPLARIFFAALPYASGVRYNPHAPTFGDQLHSVFYDHGDYRRNLILARCGTLVFFILGAAALAAWTRRELGGTAAIVATLLFTTQPIVIGYSALAMHDGAAVAGVAVSLLALSRWLERRDLRRAAELGLAYGFAILCKFSCLPFVPLACAAIYAVRFARDGSLRRTAVRDLAVVIAVVPALAALTTWGGYGFSIGRVADLEPWGRAVPRAIMQLDPQTRIPAPAFVAGLSTIIHTDRGGFISYAFGEITTHGWWWYFPVALLLKTTLAFLLILAVGLWLLRGARAWSAAEALAATLAILALASLSTLDVGVRYVLPVYVPLTFAAAACVGAMLERRVGRYAAAALVAAHLLAGAVAHPDYFPFFNAFGGRDPGRYLLDSNLDWGQDVLRLRDTARELHVDRLGVALMGLTDLDAVGLPPNYPLDARVPSTGWVAVSEHALRMIGYSWLADRPYRRVGRSIRLYYIR